MKIKLPNPDDFDSDVDGFLEQLELCVHHARKAWGKMKASKDEVPDAYISYRVNVLEDNYDEYSAIIDKNLEQDIDIEIKINLL